VDASTRAKVIECVLAEIDHSYVYPDVGTRMVMWTREKQQRHEYDSIFKATELAERLTRISQIFIREGGVAARVEHHNLLTSAQHHFIKGQVFKVAAIGEIHVGRYVGFL
jgi:hypothetical protein